MIDHVTIRVADVDSAGFYRLALGLLDGPTPDGHGPYLDWGDFSLALATDERPPTERLHLAFQATGRDDVDAWWRAMRDAGHPDLGPPGPRPEYTPTYYGAFVADPAGNSVEAVHHQPRRTDDTMLDHLWVRVRDLDASTRFYETLAPTVGYEVRRLPDRTMVHQTGSATLSLLRGDPTVDLHLAFSAPDTATVEAFHDAGTRAGYRSLGAPGLRPEYHAGYHGAFLADPDGNSIEAVHHDRR